ncbi:MAG TPA: di-heme oxidoredictase family protein [Streptosporangiaceae bacterium]
MAAAMSSVLVAAEGGAFTRVVSEAPTSMDTTTNGFATQDDMDDARDQFEEVEFIANGLGPVYNAQSCRDCHQNPVTGGSSQVTELRTGHYDGASYVEPPGGSLNNDRAIDPSLQERIMVGQEVRAFRLSPSLMGDGFVEAIDSNTLVAIATAQPAGQRGMVIQVPVVEAPGNNRVGRFGWKNQNCSLLSFAADAYVNEVGITSPLQPTENTSNGRSVTAFDTVADPEDSGVDTAKFALFMRSLKAPSVDVAQAATASAQRGSQLFDACGCAVCHVRSINTAPAGTVINGGTYAVPPALGDKTIHPFSDFLLHDVGTGDGIVQNGGQLSRNMVRTAPLWGMRARARLMHDGLSVSRTDAILRHGGQAAGSVAAFARLPSPQQTDVLNFLNSL